jgi:hypothetical protein
MHHAVRVEQHIVRLYIAVHDALLVDVAHGAAKLGDPEAHRLLGEGLARDVEAQVATIHQVHDDVQVLDVLEAVAQIAEERVVEVLEHAALANYVADTLGAYDCYTTSAYPAPRPPIACKPTFVLPYVLERKCEARVLALDDAHLAKGALADYTQQPEVVEVHCVPLSVSLLRRGSWLAIDVCLLCWTLIGTMESRLCDYAPWSVNTTGFPLLWPMVGDRGSQERLSNACGWPAIWQPGWWSAGTKVGGGRCSARRQARSTERRIRLSIATTAGGQRQRTRQERKRRPRSFEAARLVGVSRCG